MKLEDFVQSIIGHESETIKEIAKCFSTRHMTKGESFADRGERAEKIGYIERGVMRAYHLNENGGEYNKTFFKDGSFVGAYSSLVSLRPNLIDIDCLTDCDILQANYSDIRNLYDRFPKVERLSRILAEQFFVAKEKREIELATLEAKDRYHIFQAEHPGLELIIPQYHIASYLGISPTQLSRIRAQS